MPLTPSQLADLASTVEGTRDTICMHIDDCVQQPICNDCEHEVESYLVRVHSLQRCQCCNRWRNVAMFEHGERCTQCVGKSYDEGRREE